MSQRSFLGDMLTTIFERRQAKPVARDKRSLHDMCLALLDAEGEVAGIRLAQAILDRYAGLTAEERHAFFDFLTHELEIDLSALETAVEHYARTGALEDYRKIGQASEPRRPGIAAPPEPATRGDTRACPHAHRPAGLAA